MKFISKIAIALFLTISFFACSSEESEQTNQELKTIEDVLTEMKVLAKEQNKVVQFEVTYIDGMYKSEFIKSIDKFEHNFQVGYNSKMSDGVTVECSDGTTTNCSGENEGSCVGAAVKACLDGGGCATVCPATLTMAP
jgi:hypothetical protein